MSKSIFNVTVTSGQSVSSSASLRGAALKAVFVPAGTAASWVTFRRIEGPASGPCRNWDAQKLSAAIVPGSWLELTAGDLAGADQLAVELCDDETGTAAPQAQPVTLTLLAI